MKKFAIGLISGIIIASAASVSAETVSIIGKKIDAVVKVTINGKQLPVDAITVSGKSYVPLADIGAATGYEVKYSKLEGITLTSETGPNEVPVSEPTPQPTPERIPGTSWEEPLTPAQKIGVEISKLEIQIASANAFILGFSSNLRTSTDETEKAEYQKKIDEQLALIKEMTKKIQELETQKAALQP